MATVDDAHKQRWNAVKTGITYVPTNGIPTAWRQHPEWGSPLGPEIGIEGGGVAQAFTGGVVKWTPDRGAELVTE
jgi:hypothetical protein